MESFETNDFVLVGYDRLTNIRDSVVFSNMEALNYESMVNFCMRFATKNRRGRGGRGPNTIPTEKE